MTRSQISSPWWPRWVRLQLIALAAMALGAAVRWVAGWSTLPAVPAGLILAGAAVLILFFVRKPLPVVFGVVVSVVVALNLASISDNRLSSIFSSDLVAVFFLVQVAGVLLAAFAGIAALIVSARHLPRPPVARIAQVVGLLLLAPICAEYLSAYDDSTGDPVALLSGLFFFIPLYGCAALLIREVARRARLGWVGIVLLATAFGILQAGVWDQSMFSPDYRGIEGWADGYRATLIAPLGLNVYNALTFVGGHVVASICAPIALIESTRPDSADRPWFGRVGLVLTGVAWMTASVFVLIWHLQTEDSHASSGQITGAVVVALALIAAAYGLGFRRLRTPQPRSARTAPRVAVVFVASMVLFGAQSVFPGGWAGVATHIASWGLVAVGLLLASRRQGWGVRHIAAAAAAPLLVQGALAFTYNPVIGDVTAFAKYAHNVVMLAIVLGVVALAFRASRPHRDIEARVPQEAGRTAG